MKRQAKVKADQPFHYSQNHKFTACNLEIKKGISWGGAFTAGISCEACLWTVFSHALSDMQTFLGVMDPIVRARMAQNAQKNNEKRHYAVLTKYGTAYVKTWQLFVEQGGTKQAWGRNWQKIAAPSIGEAYAKAWKMIEAPK